jgi:precorrin-6A/cobalt-precorrin-6A reductase
MAFKVLILGGTGEGRWLSERLATDARYQTLLSFAGRTESLARPGLPHRVGGFGGVDGLSTFLREGDFRALVDTTHPYAARISANAVAAAARTHTPLLRLSRPIWRAVAGDRWIEVPHMEAAARATGSEAKRVFLTVGRQETPVFAGAPQHDYLVRAIDDFQHGLRHAQLILARGPFALADERALLERERVQLLVSKNAGTPATYPKLQAARELQIPVIMVARPTLAEARETDSLDGVLAWLDALHGASPSLRGE